MQATKYAPAVDLAKAKKRDLIPGRKSDLFF